MDFKANWQVHLLFFGSYNKNNVLIISKEYAAC